MQQVAASAAVNPAAAQADSSPRDLFSVAQFAQRRPAWSQSALRYLILCAEDRIGASGERIPGNGLAEAAAIVRVGRRVLIDEAAFFRWIARQAKGARREAAA